MQFLIINAGCTYFGHGGTLSAAMARPKMRRGLHTG